MGRGSGAAVASPRCLWLAPEAENWEAEPAVDPAPSGASSMMRPFWPRVAAKPEAPAPAASGSLLEGDAAAGCGAAVRGPSGSARTPSVLAGVYGLRMSEG